MFSFTHRSTRSLRALLAAVFALALTAGFAAGCGSSSDESTESDAGTAAEESSDSESAESDALAPESDGVTSEAEAADRPVVAVTTGMLGDVATRIVGSQADVITVMPPGADPHNFQPSAQQVGQVLEADALVVNGGFFEEGLLDVIDQAADDEVPVFEALGSVSTLEAGEGSHAHDHGGEGKGEDADHVEGEDHGDEDHGHDYGDTDPHFFTDPNRMSEAVTALSAFFGDEVAGLDADLLEADTASYLDELAAVDAEIAEVLASVPEERRVLITNHDVFSYFADQYDFEVVGVVIPSGSTSDAANAGDLAELIEIIEDEQVPAIFSDSSVSSDLVEIIASDVGDIEVVELYSESLGEAGSDGDTYVEMLRANAARISAALS